MRKWLLFLLAVSEPLPVEVAAIDHDFLRGRELKVPQKKVSICHYNARLGKFNMVEVPESQLKNHIGIHGPAVGYKDMTVADANELLYPSSYDCSCVSTNLGDGLNCIESEWICHYDARVGMFSMIEIPKAELKNHIGIHGPAIGYKDMTVAHANELLYPSSSDCTCVSTNLGDGLNCIESEWICHYDARVGKFSMIEIPKAELKDHIGIHGPEIGYKDMTVADTSSQDIPGTQGCNCLPGYIGDGLNCVETSVYICHYDANLGKFSPIWVPKAELKDHIGIHGPAIGYKDMTVEDANELPHRSANWDCRCAFGYGGDGLNCVETPNAASATCYDQSNSFSTSAGVPYVITWEMMSSKGSFGFYYGVKAATPYDLQIFHSGKLLFHDPAVMDSGGISLRLRGSSKSTTTKTVFTGTDPGYVEVFMACPH